jgi:hypothetical protein
MYETTTLYKVPSSEVVRNIDKVIDKVVVVHPLMSRYTITIDVASMKPRPH